MTSQAGPGRRELLRGSLRSWPHWMETLSAQGGDDISAAWREALLPERRFRSNAEASAWEPISDWLACEQRPGLVLLLSGIAGTGKTWLLAALGERLSEEHAVYVCDLRRAGGLPDLGELAGGAPEATIVLVDDAREQDATRLLVETAQTPNLLVIATADPVSAVRLGGLLHPAVSRLELPHTVCEADDLELYPACGESPPSSRQWLRHTNLRHAVATLRGDHARVTAARIERLRHDAGLVNHLWPLLVASSVGVRMPAGLLDRYAVRHGGASSLPAELSAFLVRHDAGGSPLYWFEDAAVATQVLNRVARAVGRHDLAVRRRRTVRGLIECAEPAIEADRTALRQLLSRLPRHDRVRCVDGLGAELLAMMRREQRPELAFQWLSAAGEIEDPAVHERFAAAAAEVPAPRSRAEVLLLCDAIGASRSAARVLAHVSRPTGWSPEPWIATLDAVEALPRDARRQLRRALRTAFESGLVDPLPLRGRPDVRSCAVYDRTWALATTQMTPDVRCPDRSVRRYLDLTSRMLSEPRHELALRVAICALGSEPRSVRELEIEVERLYASEAEHDRIGTALSRTLAIASALARGREPRAGQIYAAHVNFAHTWRARPELSGVAETLAHVDAELGTRSADPRALSGPLRAVLRIEGDTGGPRAATRMAVSRQLIALARADARRDAEQRDAGLLVLAALGAAAGGPDPLATTARTAILSLVLDSSPAVGEFLAEFSGSDTGIVEVPPVPPALFLIRPGGSERLIGSALSIVPHAAADEADAIVPAILELVRGRSPRLWRRAFADFVRLDASEAAAEAMRCSGAADPVSADDHALHATFQARFGSLERARRHGCSAAERYFLSGDGPHPERARHAFSALAASMTGPDAALLQAAAELLVFSDAKRAPNPGRVDLAMMTA